MRYFVGQPTYNLISHIVSDNRPVFPNFTLAKYYFVKYCNSELECAKNSAHKSFKWVFSKAPSSITKKECDDLGERSSVDILLKGSHIGYTTCTIQNSQHYETPKGPLLTSKTAIDDYIKAEW